MAYTINVPEGVENEAAYIRAAEARIDANRRKGAFCRWTEKHEDAQLLNDWLFNPQHPLAFYANGDFLNKMRDAIDEWGGLTDGQHVAVRKCYQRAQENSRERAERRLAKIEDERNTSKHIGSVGERREFTLICEKQFSFDGTYGTTYINICKDEEGNVIVYKGSNAITENITVVVIATVKAHEERDGVAQTIIARPKVK